jgi:hypothetical protein
MWLRRKHVAAVGIVRASTDVGMSVVCTAHVQAPSTEVSATAQPFHVALSGQAAAL